MSAQKAPEEGALSGKIVDNDPWQHPGLNPKEERPNPPSLDGDYQPKGLASTSGDCFENILFNLGHQSAQPLILGRPQYTASHQDPRVTG